MTDHAAWQARQRQAAERRGAMLNTIQCGDARELAERGQREREEMLNTIELCAGIGGFSSSCTHPLAFVEIEPVCRTILRRHYPGALILNDVRECGAQNLPPCDILKFGFPCQDLSVAGKRAGLGGTRSSLFYECTRIADELRPSLLLWENVPGLLSSREGKDFLAVLTELERIGYCGAWTTLDAQWFGVAQRRQRVFGVFARRDIGAKLCAEILALPARMPGYFEAGGEKGERVAPTLESGTNRTGGTRPPGTTVDTAETLIPFDLAQITSNVNRTRAEPGLPASTLNSSGQMHVCGAQSAAHGGPDDNSGQAGHIIAFDWQAGDDSKFTDEDRGRKWIARAGDYTGAIGSTRRDGVAGTFGVRRLTPRECERLQGFPDDWTAWGIDEQDGRIDLSDSARYRALGNAVNRKVSAWIDSRIVEVLS